MLAGQGPARLFAMVEQGRSPVAGVVAVRALLAMPARVNVVAAVAGTALRGGGIVFEVAEMTGLAGAVPVRPAKGKAGFRAVVE